MATASWKKDFDSAAEYANEWVASGCPGRFDTWNRKDFGQVYVATRMLFNGEWRFSIHNTGNKRYSNNKCFTAAQRAYYDLQLPGYMCAGPYVEDA
jgi:hypothetical protein